MLSFRRLCTSGSARIKLPSATTNPELGRFVAIATKIDTSLLSDHPAQLVFLTNRVGRQLAKVSLSTMQFENFQPLGTHIGLMSDLRAKDGQRQQDLAITGVKDKATVARSLAQLEDEGFVVRVNDAVDRRQKLIFLTPKGERFWKFIEVHMKELLPELTKDIDPHKMATCLEVLASLYSSLHEHTFTPESSNHA